MYIRVIRARSTLGWKGEEEEGRRGGRGRCCPGISGGALPISQIAIRHTCHISAVLPPRLSSSVLPSPDLAPTIPYLTLIPTTTPSNAGPQISPERYLLDDHPNTAENPKRLARIAALPCRLEITDNSSGLPTCPCR